MKKEIKALEEQIGEIQYLINTHNGNGEYEKVEKLLVVQARLKRVLKIVK